MSAHAPADHGTGHSLTLSFGVLASGIATSSLGLLALLGWGLGLPWLASFGENLMPMAPSTAIVFLLYGAAVCLRARPLLSRRVFWISVAAGCLGALIALLLFALGCLDIQWSVENLGLNATGTVRGATTGHMSPVTAFCFLLASVSFLGSLSLSPTRPWRTALAFGAAGVLLGLCLIFLLAYLYGAPLLYGGRFIPPALNTILAFAMLGLALLTLAGRPARQFAGSPMEGSRMAFPLVLIFTLLAALIIATGYIYYRHFEQDYRAEAEHQLSTVAQLKVSELTHWREERMADGAIFLKNPSFSALVRRFFARPADADAQRQLMDWLGKFPMVHGNDQIRLLDAEGVTRLSAPGGLNPATSDTLQGAAEVLGSGQMAFQDFYRHERDHRVYLRVMVPLFDEQAGSRPLGVLVLRVDPTTYLYPCIQRWPTPSRSAETLLVRREGKEILFLNELRFQTNAALSLRAPLTRKEQPAVMAALGTQGIVEGRDYRGVRVIAAVRAIPDSPWFLVARMDTAEVYAPLRERLWLTVFFAGILLISSGAVAGLLWRRRHLQVYEERAQAAEALGASEHRFRNLFDSSRDAVMTLEPPSWKFTSGNPATMAMFGARNAEHFVMLGPADLSPERQPDGRASAERARETIETAMREGSHLFEWTHQRINGQEFPATVLLSRVEAAGKVFLQATIRDITERKQSEESLRLRSAALEATANAIVITDHHGTIQLVNPAFTALTGYTAQEAVGQNPRILKGGKQDEAFYRNLWQTIASGQVWNGQLTNRRKDGSLYAEEMTITPLRDAGGVIARYVAIKQDITERQRAAEALRQSEEQFRAMFDLASVGIAQADPHTGQWLRVNQKMCEITGYSAGELLRMRVPDITHPEDRQLDWGAFERVVRGEAPDYRMEKRYVRKDGSLAWVNVNMTIIRDAAGQPARTMAAIEDITERKRAEGTLREIELRLAHAMGLAQLVAWEYDVASGLFNFSDRFYALHGTTAELEGGNLMCAGEFARKFVHPDDAHLVGEEVGKAVAAAGADYRAQVECRVFRRGGELRHVSVTISVTKDAAGRTIKLHGANQDITERKAAETELARLQKQLLDASRQAGMAEIATSVLHNVGNVLNSVNVSTGLLVESARKSRASGLSRVVDLLQEHAHDLGAFTTQDPRGKHVPAYLAQLAGHFQAEQAANVRELQLLRRNVEHIKEIVAMQQNYATFGGVKEIVNVVHLVEDSLRINEGALNRHEVAVVREFGEVPLLNVEKHKILQILVNLLRNAKHACQDSERADRRLTVRVADGEGRIRISVIDNGVGIPAENLARIFNHGFTTRKDGHGFGLHSGALAAQEMGGSLTVRSDGPGQGAAFTLELPYPARENSHE